MSYFNAHSDFEPYTTNRKIQSSILGMNWLLGQERLKKLLDENMEQLVDFKCHLD
jgi:hypothetical protein